MEQDSTTGTGTVDASLEQYTPHRFEYQALSPGEIRLIKLRHASDVLDFSIEHVNLVSAPPYAALSYVWGEALLNESILLNSRPFGITQNLHSALHQLHRGTSLLGWPTRYPLQGYLWVDAICIDQSETGLAERGEQVTMMGRIFEKANPVLAWLGPASDPVKNNAAAERLHDMYQLLAVKYRSLTAVDSEHLSMSAQVRAIGYVVETEKRRWNVHDESTRMAWSGIIDMWASDWWKRVWTLQEGTYVNRELHSTTTESAPGIQDRVLFVSGEVSTTFSRLNCASWVATALLHAEVEGYELLEGSHAMFQRVRGVLFWRQREDVHNGLLEIINVFRSGVCTDPRDKLYAVRGLLDSPARHLIRPDYSKEQTVARAYTEFAANHLTSTQSFDILGYTAKHGHRYQHPSLAADGDILPSWVPDWTDPIKLEPLPKILHIQGSLRNNRQVTSFTDRSIVPEFTISRRRAYNACGAYSTAQISTQGNRLHVRGAWLDVIHDMMQDAAPGSDTETVADRMQRWDKQLTFTSYPNSTAFARDFHRVQCADIRMQYCPALLPVGRGYQDDMLDLFFTGEQASPDEAAAMSVMADAKVCLRESELCV